MNHKRKFGLTLEELSKLSRTEREQHSLKARKKVFYFKEEAIECRKTAEKAVLEAAPFHDLSMLNGLNIGAGSRIISEYLIPIDLKRDHKNGVQLGSLLAPMMPLPFKPNVIDYIISVHSLEHVPNPIETVCHWIDILKPGGGIGIILPDWRYCSDASKDNKTWGHKWNSEPKVMLDLFEKYWSKETELIQLDSYDFKISFDFVIRKKGNFQLFDSTKYLSDQTGHKMFLEGKFLGPIR